MPKAKPSADKGVMKKVQENNTLLKKNHSFLKDNNGFLKKNHSFLKENNALIKKNHAFLKHNNAFLKNNNAFLKNNNALLKTILFALEQQAADPAKAQSDNTAKHQEFLKALK